MNMPNWNRLRKTIAKGEVLMPWDDEYETSSRRWSIAAQMKSVRPLISTNQAKVPRLSLPRHKLLF